jgi:hypothetical protein
MRHYVSNNLPHGQGLSVSELRWTIHPKIHKGTFSAVTVEFSEMEMVTFGILCSFFSEVTEEIAVEVDALNLSVQDVEPPALLKVADGDNNVVWTCAPVRYSFVHLIVMAIWLSRGLSEKRDMEATKLPEMRRGSAFCLAVLARLGKNSSVQKGVMAVLHIFLWHPRTPG